LALAICRASEAQPPADGSASRTLYHTITFQIAAYEN
jgi:hypothetical protein